MLLGSLGNSLGNTKRWVPWLLETSNLVPPRNICVINWRGNVKVLLRSHTHLREVQSQRQSSVPWEKKEGARNESCTERAPSILCTRHELSQGEWFRAIEIGPFGQRQLCEPSLTSQNTHRLSITSTQLLENLTASNTHTEFAKMTSAKVTDRSPQWVAWSATL